MSESHKCSRCGTELPPDAPGGHCIACLLQLGLEAGETATDPPESSTATLPTEKPGDRIGRYKLLQQIGEGGCGVVYMAEQEEPVRRRVALKVIKLGMDTRQVIARFEAERQALALMDHPNIAKVLDAGATESGRPYFVMELVRGIKITDYCDQQKLSTRQRLDLFIPVCQAIQHAHQKGVIHRDLKPSNILVTEQDGRAVPKIIDFGIAKTTTDQRLTDKTLFTAFEQFIGTPAYMSPEQAGLGGLDVDTRSDIYSLGVLLYELLTGHPPFDAEQFARSALDEILRVIREKEPHKPSTRLTQELVAADVRRLHSKSEIRDPETEEEVRASSRRLLQMKELIHLLRGDLDWIVMKALEKDRTRRYETANGLARDIERHLNNEPVVARPPSNLYRFRKLVRRNKLVFEAGAAVATALVLGVVVSSWQAIRATRAEHEQSRLLASAQQAEAKEIQLRQEAEAARQQAEEARSRSGANEHKAQTESAKSQQVAQFLKDMLKGVGPSVAKGHDTAMLREILDTTAKRVTNDLHEQPDVESQLLNIIGEVYEDLGDDQKAEQMHREALVIRRKLFGGENPLVAESLAHLCYSLWRQRVKGIQAEETGREAVELYRTLKRKSISIEDSKMAYALDQLAHTLYRRGKYPKAEAAAREALTLSGSGENPARAYALKVLGEVLLSKGKPDEAEPLLREAVGIDGIGGSYNVEILATVLADQSKFEEAEALLHKSLDFEKQNNYQDAFVHSLRTLGKVLLQAGKPIAAETVLREDLEIITNQFGKGHRIYGWALFNLGEALQQQGKFSEAEAVYQEALPEYGARHRVLFALGTVLRAQHRLDEAVAIQRQSLAIRPHVVPGNDPGHLELASSLEELGGILLERGQVPQVAEVESLFREALSIREEVIRASKAPGLSEGIQHLIQRYEAMGLSDKAAEWKRNLAEFDKAAK